MKKGSSALVPSSFMSQSFRSRDFKVYLHLIPALPCILGDGDNSLVHFIVNLSRGPHHLQPLELFAASIKLLDFTHSNLSYEVLSVPWNLVGCYFRRSFGKLRRYRVHWSCTLTSCSSTSKCFGFSLTQFLLLPSPN